MAAHGPRWARRLLLVAATGLLSGPAAGVNHPFGAHTSSYATGAILPDHVSQAATDQAVRDFYDAWKGQVPGADLRHGAVRRRHRRGTGEPDRVGGPRVR